MLRVSVRAREEACSLEEGGAPRRLDSPSKARARAKRRPYAAAALACALCAAAALAAAQAAALRMVEARVAEQGAVCLTPLHVWRRPWLAVSFANVSLIRPAVLSGEGRVLSRETSTLCPAAPARSVVRFESVAVQYRSLPLLRRHVTVLGGERAACLQHMLDLFKGVSPCGGASPL